MAAVNPVRRKTPNVAKSQMLRAGRAQIAVTGEHNHSSMGTEAAAKRTRNVPLPNIEDEIASIRTQYALALADATGAIGLYLHGAVSLPNPSLADVENLKSITEFMHDFALGSVGFHLKAV